jgi:hypothetical protein
MVIWEIGSGFPCRRPRVRNHLDLVRISPHFFCQSQNTVINITNDESDVKVSDDSVLLQ